MNEEDAARLVDECQIGIHYPLIGDKLLARALFSISSDWSGIVETGTFMGATSLWFSKVWSQLSFYTIDIVEGYVSSAKAKGLNAIWGDSAEVLKSLVSSFGTKPFFFLDAHWYERWPLSDELKVISGLDTPTILVHDFDDQTEAGFDPGNDINGPVGEFLAARSDMKLYRLKENKKIGVGLLSNIFESDYWETMM